MMTPTKVWKFDDIYSIKVLDRKLTAKVLIDWPHAALYDRACIDLFAAMSVLTEHGLTFKDWVNYKRIGNQPAIQAFSTGDQFVDESEALRIAEEFKAALKDLSKLP